MGRILVLILVTAAIAAGVYLIVPDLTAQPQKAGAKAASAPSSRPIDMDEHAAEERINPTPGNTNQEDDILAHPPTTQALRKEVEQDPHSTPNSLIGFSAALGEELEQALASDDEAAELVERIGECVRGAYDSTTQAVCLVAARELGATKEKFKAEVDNIYSLASPEAREMAGLTQ